MRRARRPAPLWLILLSLASATACRNGQDGTIRLPERAAPSAVPVDGPPVAVNPVSPVEYPPALLAKGIEGLVLLRLHVDASGRVIPDSIRVAESSGYPALDSAARAGAPGLRFAPALHRGRPVALSFIQPVQFRAPRAGGSTP